MNHKSLSALKGLIIDMDGVLWRGSEPLRGLVDFFAFLRAREIRLVLATNNSSQGEAQYVERLASHGVQVNRDEIVTSSSATAEYLTTILPTASHVYVIGMQSLKDALTRRGFIVDNTDAAAVVVGIDWEISYEKLKRATLLIRAGAKFIGSNPDKTFPSPEGISPGTGALLAALEAATDVKPEVVGKPQPLMYKQAMQRLKLAPDVVAALGDRLDTDILGAIRSGIKSILVMSGVTSPALLAESEVKPDWVFEDIFELVKQWESDTRSE